MVVIHNISDIADVLIIPMVDYIYIYLLIINRRSYFDNGQMRFLITSGCLVADRQLVGGHSG